MPRKHRPPRARFWLGGENEASTEMAYNDPELGEDNPMWQAHRGRRGVQGLYDAEWLAAFSRTHAKRPGMPEKTALLPGPPPMFSRSSSYDGSDAESAWERAHAPWRCGVLVLAASAMMVVTYLLGAHMPCVPFPLSWDLSLGWGRGNSGPELPSSSPSPAELDHWLRAEAHFAWNRILDNIGPAAGASDGIVVASPSTGGGDEPDYYYTWTRDAALTVSSLLPFFLPGAYLRPWEEQWHRDAPVARAHKGRHPLLEGLVRSYVAAQADLQAAPNPSGDLWRGGLSEPKFEVDGEPFTGDWGRPQRDGPALRALALIPYAHWLLDRGYPADIAYVRDQLYDAHKWRRPGSVIKNDLEEVASQWQNPGYDLWEETHGRHLWTDAVSRRAMQAGVGLALRLGDEGAAEFYAEQAERLSARLESYSDNDGTWRATDRYPLKEERTGLDAAILLASVHTGVQGDAANATRVDLAPSDPTMLATLRKYVRTFSHYDVNEGEWTDGWLVGRYAEDVYDGVGFTGGNAWYITTFTVAHVLYLAQAEFAAEGRIEVDSASRAFWADVLGPDATLLEWRSDAPLLAGETDFDTALSALGHVADAFLVRASRAVRRGHMSEQIGRDDGVSRGARDLTWSYASFLDVKRAREHAERAVRHYYSGL